MEVDDKPEVSIARVVEFKRTAEETFGKDHHLVSKVENELVELREQRDHRLPLRTKITRLDAEIKRINKAIDTQASVVAGIQEEVQRQLALSDEAKAKEAQLRADLISAEGKRRDALRSEAAMPITPNGWVSISRPWSERQKAQSSLMTKKKFSANETRMLVLSCKGCLEV